MANKRETMANKSYTTEEKKMSKEVQVVAYLTKQDCESEVGVMDHLDDSHDYTAESSRTTTKYVVADADEIEQYDTDEYGDLSDDDPDWYYGDVDEDTFEALEGSLDDSLTARKMEYVTESKKNNTWTFCNQFRRDVMRDVELTRSGDGLESRFGRKAKSDGRTVFKAKTGGLQKMRLLRHQSEIEDGNMYVDDDTEYWCVDMTLIVDKVLPSTYRWFDDTVIPEIVSHVAQHDWVSRMRIMDCEREYSEEGVCYGL